MHSFTPGDDSLDSVPCFTHIHLSTLNLARIDNYYMDGVWQTIRLPKLKNLTIYIDLFDTRNPFEELKDNGDAFEMYLGQGFV
ncbi:hypothetical protein BT96DRAFT_912135 [Gymnopus androsaceus JB14]|uniref:Uncharacterized protein n=1 Tax=Gymnopus androsaceus JB14 TaxID=1447944 RepID=A0A6A4IME0_9AGAR|nr:hypothetical protein BT96DRAFT_912135 [Gymnopus androsaceus JB14]